eukprot:g5043.t1
MIVRSCSASLIGRSWSAVAAPCKEVLVAHLSQRQFCTHPASKSSAIIKKAKKKKKEVDEEWLKEFPDMPLWRERTDGEPQEKSSWGIYRNRPREPVPMSIRYETLPHMYTRQQHVAQHSQEDVGKYYEVADKVASGVPGWLSKALEPELSRCQNCLRIRQPGYDIVQQLKKVDEGAADSWAGQAVAITGRAGVGKTATLHYVAQYAVEQGWLLLSTFGDEFLHERLGFLNPSPHDEAIFDQPRYFAKYLSTLLHSNGELLARVRLKQTHYAQYKWALDESKGSFEMEELAKVDAPPGQTLRDLVEYAVKNPSQVAPLLQDIMRELYLATEVKILVLIDDRNKWDMISSFNDPRKDGRVPLMGHNLGLVDAFTSFTVAAPKNGVCVWATCGQRHAFQRKVPQHLEKAHHHFALDAYNDQELWACVTHYTLSDFCKRPVLHSQVNKNYVAVLKGFTGSVPKEIHNYLNLF